MNDEMSEIDHALNTKPISQWTDKDLKDFTGIAADHILNATEENDSLQEALFDILVITRIITVAQLKREEAFRQEIGALAQNLRACIDEVVIDNVEFEFHEFDKRNKEVLDRIKSDIERLNTFRDRFLD